MILITRRSKVAVLGGHFIYHSEGTELHEISPVPTGLAAEDARQKNAFLSVHLSKNFYFRCAVDRLRPSACKWAPRSPAASAPDSQLYLRRDQHPPAQPPARRGFSALRGQVGLELAPAATCAALPAPAEPLDSAPHPRLCRPEECVPFGPPLLYTADVLKCLKELAVFGRTVYVTLIARRSRHFAGARFLRRGVNDQVRTLTCSRLSQCRRLTRTRAQGFVANDVESEQIVAEALTTPFYTSASSSHTHSSATPSPPLPPTFPTTHQARRPSPSYTAHVQCRGSIPLYWSQDVARALKPPIELAMRDPYYAAAAKHFDGLFRAYGPRVIVLNLIKVRRGFCFSASAGARMD